MDEERQRMRGPVLGLVIVVALMGALLFGWTVYKAYHFNFPPATMAFLLTTTPEVTAEPAGHVLDLGDAFFAALAWSRRQRHSFTTDSAYRHHHPHQGCVVGPSVNSL